MMSRIGYGLAATAAMVLFCGADVERDQLSMKEALRGHWATQSGRTHFYFGDNGKLVMVGDGQPYNQTYEILDTDTKQDQLRIQILPAGSKEGGHQKTLRFGVDRIGLLATIEKDGIATNFIWIYIDGRTAPEAKKVESILDK